MEKLVHGALWYQAIFDAMADLVLIKGSDSQLLWANKAFRDYYGMDEAQLAGIVDGPQSDPDDTLQYVRDDRMVFDTGQHLDVPSEAITDSDGEVRYFHTIKSPIFDDGKMVSRTVGVSRPLAGELTERQRAPDHVRAKQLASSFRQIVTSFPLPVLLLDVRLQIIGQSPHWNEAFGRSHGSSLDDLDEPLRPLQTLAEQVVEGREAKTVQLWVGGRAYEIMANTWRYDPAATGGVMIAAIDVTERLQRERDLKTANERYDLVLQGASVGIWDWDDTEAELGYWSPRFYELLGYENGEIPATLANFADTLHPDDRERTFGMVDSMLAGETDFDLEHRLRSKDGKYRWYRGTGQVSRNADGSPRRMVGSIQDIDGRRRAEQELQEINQDLEHFVHIAAHDLREPSRRQLLLTDLILEEFGDEVSPKLRSHLTILQTQARQILDLVSAFRALTNIAGPAAEMNRIDLRELLEKLLAEQAAVVDLEVASVDVPESIIGHRTLVEMLYRNLLTNAVKHGVVDDLGLVISSSVDEQQLTFTVENRWIAPPEDIQQYLKPFVQGGRGVEGSGIGLSICRRVVMAHAGRLWLEATQDRFRVNFTLGDQL